MQSTPRRRSEIYFFLPANFELDDATNVWVAECPALKVVTQASSEDEARSALSDAVELFLHNCDERGILRKVLSDYGFNGTAVADSQPPISPSSERFGISVRPKMPRNVVAVPAHLLLGSMLEKEGRALC